MGDKYEKHVKCQGEVCSAIFSMPCVFHPECGYDVDGKRFCHFCRKKVMEQKNEAPNLGEPSTSTSEAKTAAEAGAPAATTAEEETEAARRPG